MAVVRLCVRMNCQCKVFGHKMCMAGLCVNSTQAGVDREEGASAEAGGPRFYKKVC